MIFDILSSGEMFAFFMSKFDRGDETAEVLITFQTHRHERQNGAVVHGYLCTDDRPDALSFRFEMKTYRSGDGVSVEQCDMRHSQFCRSRR